MVFYRVPDGASVAPPAGCVAVLGFFDGVHPGHRELFRVARRLGAPVVAWTFLSRGRTGLLTDDATRFSLLGDAGADYIVAADFEKMREKDGPSFVRDELVSRLRASRAVCGTSFRFGRDAAWDSGALADLCREAGIPATVVPTVTSDGRPVSSSAAREAILRGDAEGAARILGREHFYRLPVVRGKMLARLLGFPTANQIIPKQLVVPAHGVYVCRASTGDGSFPGVLNVGVCPTLDEEGIREFRRENPDYELPDGAITGSVVMETHVIGYDGDLYGKMLRVDLCRRLRPEIRFDSTDGLVRAVRKDEEAAIAYFEKERK